MFCHADLVSTGMHVNVIGKDSDGLGFSRLRIRKGGLLRRDGNVDVFWHDMDMRETLIGGVPFWMNRNTVTKQFHCFLE